MSLVDFAYYAALLLVWPFLLLKVLHPRGRRHLVGLEERLGRCAPRRSQRPCILIHGVSVGEIRAAGPLIQALERELPDYEIVLSTTTGTGQEVARRTWPHHRVIYYPLDFSWAVRRVLRAVRPELVVLVELEIWPNFLTEAFHQGISVVLVNGRISEKSYRGYRKVRSWLFDPLGKIASFCVQTERYAERFRLLGIPADQIRVTGSVKYDQLDTVTVDDAATRADMGLTPSDRVLIGGSTHPGEERALLEAYAALRARVPDLRLVLVPRHTERCDELERLTQGLAPGVERRSRRLAQGTKQPLAPGHVLLVDTIGELGRLYGAADVVFVGGSLIPHGGQNILEPVVLGKPTVFGPSWENFREPVERLLQARGVRQVQSAAELTPVLEELFSGREEAAAMGERGRQAILAARGATARTVEEIQRCLARREQRRARRPGSAKH